MDDEFWQTTRMRQRSTSGSGRTGALNIALLFGTAAIALALIVTPMLAGRNDDRRLASVKQDFDMITTGSIKPAEKATSSGKTYTIRRSVLQETPGSVCVVQGYSGGGGC